MTFTVPRMLQRTHHEHHTHTTERTIIGEQQEVDHGGV